MHYHVIGDIHGQVGKLKALLAKLGYANGSTWRPPAGHQAVFIGDLIDRGPEQLEVVRIVRGMIDAGDALAVLGNHEFNAIGFATPRNDRPGEFLRRHSEKNIRQHAEFLHQVGQGSARHRDLIAWFKTLPAAIDLGVIRVVHAWWAQAYVALVNERYWDGNRMSEEFLLASYNPDSPEWCAMEGLTKGLEIDLPDGYSFTDHDGHERRRVRVRWWLSGALAYRDVAIVDDTSTAKIPDLQIPRNTLPGPSAAAVPVFIGHYWLKGAPQLQSPTVACVDYSAATTGPLVAYHWQGETLLDVGHFVTSE